MTPEFLATLAGKAVAVGAALTVGIAIWGHGYYRGKVKTEQRYAAAALVAERARSDASVMLANDINEIRNKYDQAAKDNAAAVRILLDGLRSRPRRGELPRPGAGHSTAASCTGKDLYGDDAEFLAGQPTGEFADALIACYAEVDRLRAAMKKPLATR